MNAPSSTIQAAGWAGFIVATLLLFLKAYAPAFYLLIPAEYHAHLVFAVATAVGYWKKENVLPLKTATKKK